MRRVIIILCIFFFAGIAKAQVGGVRIGKESKEANPKAMLEVDSDSKGILIPRLTTSMRENMFSGSDNSAVSLLVYDLNLNKFMYWSGESWKTIGEGSATSEGLTEAVLKGTQLQLNDKNGDPLAQVDLATLYSGVRSSSAAPADGKLGDLYYNTDTKLIYLNDGFSWQPLQNMAAKLDKDAVFNGDVTGTYDNLKIKDGIVTNKEIAPNTIQGTNIALNTIQGSNIAPNTILGSNINDMGATPGQILYWNGGSWQPLTLSTDGDVSGAYDKLKIKEGVVTNKEIAPNTIQGTNIALNTIQGSNIASNTILGSNINDMGATPGQILYWNGNIWQPLTLTIDGDVSGPYDNLKIKEGVVTSVEIADKTIEAVDLSQMSATPGQVLYWNGVRWLPATLNVDGDVFGSYDQIKIKRDVITNVEIARGTIEGYNLSQMAATPGQVLQWNGWGWVPSTVTSGGDGDSDPGNEIQTLSQVLDRGSSAGNKRITDLAQPLDMNDAVTKRYVDEQISTGGGTIITVIDDLLSMDSNSALSANQGNVLNINKIDKSSVFGGDLSGTYDGLKIKEGIITNSEIASKTILGDNLNDMGAAKNQFLMWDGLTWKPSEMAKTFLGYVANPSGGTLTNSSGDDLVIPAANSVNAGLMLPTEKVKLRNDEDGDVTNELQSLAEVLQLGASAANKKITDLAYPTNDSDAASKLYVDDIVRLVSGGGSTNVIAGTGLTGNMVSGELTISLSEIASETVLANITTGTAAPIAVSLSQFKSKLGLTATDVGLDKVENKSPEEMPLSTAAIAALALKIDKSEKASANGVATLDATGKIPTSQLPAFSTSTVDVLGSQAEMLALSDAVVGSTVVRTDEQKTYILAATPASTLSNWVELLSPTSEVESVNGKKGAVVIGASDIGLGNVDNTSDLNKPISMLTQTALNLKEDLANKSTDILTDAGSDTKYPSVKAVKSYLDTYGAVAETKESILSKLGITSILGVNTGDQTDIPGTADNVRGVVDIAHGGTGQTTAAAAIKALLPSLIGNSGKVLQTDGSSISWEIPATGVTDLGYLSSSYKLTITSSSGNDVDIPLVNTTNAGLMSPNDKTKIDADKDGDNTNELQTLSQVLQLGASAGNKKISDLSDPVSDTDAATKRYVDISKGESPTGIINPSTGSEGDIFYNTTNGNLYVYDGTEWVEMLNSVKHNASLSGKGNLADPLSLATNAVGPNNLKGLNSSSLDFGTSGHVLQSNGDGTFSWKDISGGVAVDPSSLSLTTGQFFIGNADSKAEATAKSLIPISGFGIAKGDIYMGDVSFKYRIKNLLNPSDDNDAATKKYVDDKMSGSGDITAVNTGTGLTGGAVSGEVTLSLSEIASETVLANITTGTAAPTAVSLSQFKSKLGLTATDVGLDKVENKSPEEMPLSTAAIAALVLKIDKSEKASANGVATLDATGKIPTSQLPAFSTSTVDVLGSQAEMLALSDAVVGSTVVRTDEHKTYILAATPASTLSNWVELLSPTSGVESVNGYAGAVVLGASDIGLGNVENTSDLNKPISTLTQTALNLKEEVGNKSTDILTDAGSDTKYPTVKAVKSYVDDIATVVDATTTVKGKIKLSGDLSGTADIPRIATVGGVTASDISDGIDLVNNATAANSPSTIVLRDAFGDFIARNITANSFKGNLVGDISGNAATVTTNANLNGDVTSVGNTTTLRNDVVTSAKIVDKTISTADLADQAVSALKLKSITGNGFDGQILTSDGLGGFKWSDAGALPDINYTPYTTKGEIKLGSGTPAIISAGSTADASLMLPGDKTKLDKIPNPTVTDANKVLTVKADGTTEWVLPSGGSSDVPAFTAADANKVLTVNSTGTGVEWKQVVAGGGSVQYYNPNGGDPKYFVKATGPGVTVNFDGPNYTFTITVPNGVDLQYVKIKTSLTELGNQSFLRIRIIDQAARFNNSLDDVFVPEANIVDIMTNPITMHSIQAVATGTFDLNVREITGGEILLESNSMQNHTSTEGFFITLRF